MSRVLNRLQIRDYRLILAIRQTGQLVLAAETMAITQPAASRMLAEIERKIGAKLFERHPKGMAPTAMGEILSRNAANLVQGLEAAEREVSSVGAGLSGTARLGAVTGGAVGFVVPAIQELKKTARGADIHVDVGSSDMLVEGLVQGDYDFVLSRIPAGVDPRLFNVHQGRVELIHFLVRPQHPLAGKPLTGRKTVQLADLQGYEWVIQAAHTPMRKAVEEAFTSRGIALPGEIVNTTSLLVMIAYLDSTNAIAPISREVADLMASQASAKGLHILEIDDPIIIRPYHLLTYKHRIMSPLADRLLKLVMEKIRPH